MKITILPYTDHNPITKMGEAAGICQRADISDPKKNFVRGLECLKCEHNRPTDCIHIESIIEGISCKAGRDWYTHIVGSPMRLQDTTRHGFKTDHVMDYVTPKSIANNPEAQVIYNQGMINAHTSMVDLTNKCHIPMEDVTWLYNFGKDTIIRDTRDLGNMINLYQVRACDRAMWELRDIVEEFKRLLSEYDEEWKIICGTFFRKKCEIRGYCSETYPCKKGEAMQAANIYPPHIKDLIATYNFAKAELKNK